MNREQIIRDTLQRLIDAIYDAEDIDEHGASTIPSDLMAARGEAEKVLAQSEER